MCLQPRNPTCIKRNRGRRLREVILPIYFCSLRPLLQYGVQLWSIQPRKALDLLEQVQRMATKVIKALEHLSCEKKIKQSNLLFLEKGRLQESLIAAFQYIQGIYRTGETCYQRSVMTRQRSPVLNRKRRCYIEHKE